MISEGDLSVSLGPFFLAEEALMAQVPMVPGTDRGHSSLRAAEATGSRRSSWSVPGGLYPLMSAAFEVDEYRIMAGWPVPVPDCDIRIECLVSAEGDVLGNRDAPTGAGHRTRTCAGWPTPTTTTRPRCAWTPIQGDVSTLDRPRPATRPPWSPTTSTRSGMSGSPTMTALNFDSNTADYMWNDLDLTMGGAERLHA